MFDVNDETNNVTKDIEVNRNQIEVRATWLALIFDEMKKASVKDAEEILRKAITRYGVIKGDKIKSMCEDSHDMREFSEKTPSKTGQETFYMDPVKAEYDTLHLVFKYCPLYVAWKKLGIDDETCVTLCDIAMDGDRGIAAAMGFDLDITDTIASGSKTCELFYHK